MCNCSGGDGHTSYRLLQLRTWTWIWYCQDKVLCSAPILNITVLFKQVLVIRGSACRSRVESSFVHSTMMTGCDATCRVVCWRPWRLVALCATFSYNTRSKCPLAFYHCNLTAVACKCNNVSDITRLFIWHTGVSMIVHSYEFCVSLIQSCLHV